MTNGTIPPLWSLSHRSLVVEFLNANIRKLSDPFRVAQVRFLVKSFVQYCGLPPDLRRALEERLKEGQKEITRWISKHENLFDSGNKRFRMRTQHLKLYIEYVIWKNGHVRIDHSATARSIMKATEDWPLMQFQFACAYAADDVLVAYPKVLLRSFRKSLVGHPLFEFWFLVLTAGDSDAHLFDTPGLPPHQAIHDATQWAMQHGFVDVVKFVWYRLSPWQQEYLGMLHWRQLCRNFRHADLFQFVSEALHEINPRTLFRITTQIFIELVKELGGPPRPRLYRAISDPVAEIRHSQRHRKETPAEEQSPLVGIRFLLEHSMVQMRHYMLTHDNYLGLVMAGMRRDLSTFKLLVSYLNSPVDQKKLSKEVTSRVEDERLANALLRIIRESNE